MAIILPPEFPELKIKPGPVRIDPPAWWPRQLSQSGRHIVRFGDSEVRAAFHHVIPYALLRDIWNHLVDRHTSSNNDGARKEDARKALRAYILLLKPEVTAYVDDLLTQMRATWNQESIEKDWIIRDRHKTVKLDRVPLSRWDRDELWEAAVWPVWNMVEGPEGSRRSDDRGDREFDTFRAGLHPGEVKRMEAIEELYDKWLKNFARIPLDTLKIEIELAAPSIATWGAKPIQFRAEMWTENKRSPQPWSKG